MLNEHFVLLEHLAADFAEILENFRTAWHLFFFPSRLSGIYIAIAIFVRFLDLYITDLSMTEMSSFLNQNYMSVQVITSETGTYDSDSSFLEFPIIF